MFFHGEIFLQVGLVFVGKAGAYPSDAPINPMEVADDKHSSLFTTATLTTKKFYNVGTQFSRKTVRFSWFYCHKKIVVKKPYSKQAVSWK